MLNAADAHARRRWDDCVQREADAIFNAETQRNNERRAKELIPSFTNKVTTKDAKSAKEDEAEPLQIFASFARFVVTSLRSF